MLSLCLSSTLPHLLPDAKALDIWSLDHLETLLKNATTDAVLNKELRQDKVVFFLHLLGLDTTGHSYRPHSKVSCPLIALLTVSLNAIRLGIHGEYPARGSNRPEDRTARILVLWR